MAFNIHQSVLDRDGFPIEKKARQYIEELVELFVQSPEAQALSTGGDKDYEVGAWADIMLDFGLNYLALTPPKMSANDLSEILFELFPSKLSALPDAAPSIIHELRAFWKFLQREFHLANAAACLKVLDEDAVKELEEEMSNPANFGIAKSMIMMGLERGFDMTSQEGINKWIETHNAEIAAGKGLRIPLPGERSASARKVQDRIRRRITKGSWKKNRKKR